MQYHDEEVVVRNAGKWADEKHVPMDEMLQKRKMWLGGGGGLVTLMDFGVPFDSMDKPINPYDPDNPKKGRHFLGKWGPNHAADPIITCPGKYPWSPYNLLVVSRKPEKDVAPDRRTALPGGMVSDDGEEFKTTAVREAFEEALEEDPAMMDRFMKDAVPVYCGYVEDPRNTRNAWIETACFHIHLTRAEASRVKIKEGGDGGEETTAAFWMPLVRDRIDKMYAHHPERVLEAMEQAKWVVRQSVAWHAFSVLWFPIVELLVVMYAIYHS